MFGHVTAVCGAIERGERSGQRGESCVRRGVGTRLDTSKVDLEHYTVLPCI